MQALFYDQELLSRGNAPRPAHAPTAPAPTPIKVDALLPPLTATENQPAAASGGGAIAASGEPAGSGVGGGGDGDGAGGGSAWGGAGGGGLGDVNWSDDDELDAMVDDISREVDGKKTLNQRASCSVELLLSGSVFPGHDGGALVSSVGSDYDCGLSVAERLRSSRCPYRRCFSVPRLGSNCSGFVRCGRHRVRSVERRPG